MLPRLREIRTDATCLGAGKVLLTLERIVLFQKLNATTGATATEKGYKLTAIYTLPKREETKCRVPHRRYYGKHAIYVPSNFGREYVQHECGSL